MKKYLFLILFLFGISFISAASIQGSTQVSFNTAGWSCVSTSTNAYWSFTNETISGLRIDVVNSSGAVGNCSKYVSQNNNRSCCPSNRVCGSSGICDMGTTVNYCYDIKNRDSCESASLDIGKKSVESISGNPIGICGTQKSYTVSGQLCANVTNCGCYWNSTVSKCVASRVDKYNCTGTVSSSNCNWIAGNPEDHCGDALGKIFVDYTVSGSAVGQAWCNPSRAEYPCAVSVKMPFFDFFSFVLVSAGIAIVYLVMRRK